MPTFHIDEVYPKGDSYPIIVNFQNGYVTDKFRDVPCVLLEDPENGKRCIATDVESIVYSGEENKDDLGTTLILARSKTTGKVRLIECGSAHLKPVLNVEEPTENEVDTTGLELSRKFGSKKNQKVMEQRVRMKLNTSIIEEQVENATKAVPSEQLDLTTYKQENSDDSYLPPIDRQATTPENVYKIDKILTEEEYEQIWNDLESQDYKTDMHPYIKEIVESRSLSEQKTVLAVYAEHLYRLCKAAPKELMGKSYILCTLSSTLNDIILNKFTVSYQYKRTRPHQLKDKAILHLAVFLLIINNFKIDFEQFTKMVLLAPKTVETKIRITGAAISKLSSGKTIQLKIPLLEKPKDRRKSAKF